MSYLDTYTEMMQLRGLHPHTFKSYRTYVIAYLDYAERSLHKEPDEITWSEMREFIRWLQDTRKLSDRTVNMVISQLRFFTIFVLHKPWDETQLPHRKFDTFLPFVPSQDEVKTFLNSIENLKFRAVAYLMYSAGLRVGEVCNLRYEDISRKNMSIHIRHGKNRSDRYAILSQLALDALTEYWTAYHKPMGYLFPNPKNPEKPMASFWVSRHIHLQEEKLGWPERFTPHSFRHAFGTHLYEQGVELPVIQTLLGHKSLTSTMIYVHLASPAKNRFVNPLDALMTEHDEDSGNL